MSRYSYLNEARPSSIYPEQWRAAVTLYRIEHGAFVTLFTITLSTWSDRYRAYQEGAQLAREWIARATGREG